MPIALFKHHFCRRGGPNPSSRGPKAHAHAAYLSGTKLDDGYDNEANFEAKGGILHAELWVPEGTPEWANGRGNLWRSLEARENRTTRPNDAILAHKFIGALPHELSLQENIRFVKDFVREQFTRKGYAADWAIHAPDPGSDSRNFHVHIMVPLRKFENNEWADKKDRFPKNSPALSHYIKAKQEAFFNLQNRYLQKNGITAQIVRHDGRWTVTGQTSQPRRQQTEQAPSTSGYVAWPSRPTPAVGGASAAPSMPALTPTAGTTAATPSRPEPYSKYAVLNARPAGKGWPPNAILDWEKWGSRDPRRFFALWPELSTGNPGPGGGM